nr:hypothetical transcript [Hymenolepis microstoma]
MFDRYFVLYQNLLFQFESDKLDKAPCGMALLEGSYCEKTLVLRTSRDTRTAPQHEHCFTICYLPKRKKYYELRANSEESCDDWVAAIRCARYCSVIESRQELKEHQAYLLQILETERKAKLQYLQQTDELEAEIKKLKNELNAIAPAKPSRVIPTEESEQLRKIKMRLESGKLLKIVLKLAVNFCHQPLIWNGKSSVIPPCDLIMHSYH